MKTATKLWIGLGVLALLSPLGVILPDYFKSGSAWGEWEPEEIKKLAGYVPRGFKKFSGLWKAPFPDYAFQGWKDKGVGHLSLAYVFSAVFGIGLAALIVYLIGKVLAGKKD